MVDRRDSYRLAVAAGQVDVTPDPGVRVCELSSSGSGLVLDAGQDLGLGIRSLTFRLDSYPTFEAHVMPVRIRGTAEGVHIGVRFVDLDRQALSSLSRFLVERYLEQSRRAPPPSEHALVVRSAGLVRRLLRYHGVTCGRLLRLLPAAGRGIDLQLREVGRDLLQVAIPPGAPLFHEGDEHRFILGGGAAVNVFRATIRSVQPGRLELTLPREILQCGYRGSHRFPPPAERPLQMTLLHPRLAGHVLVRQVHDVSAGGFSFSFDPENDLLSPGERIDEVALDLPDGRVRVAAVVRSLRPVGDDRLWCGLELVHLGEEDRERWNRFVLRAGHPHLDLGRGELVDAAWEALASSGYLDELDVAARPRVVHAFRRAWSRHIDDSRVSRLLLLFKEGQPIGSMAANLLYPRTWILHHLGIDARARTSDPQATSRLAQEIYSGMTFVLQHMAPLEHFVLYVNASRSWNRMMYGQFVEEYPHPELLVYDRWRAYRASPSTRAVARDAPEVVEADAAVRQLIAAQLTRLRSVERQAFCYDEARLDLAEFTQQCAAMGYERERRLFVASRDGAAAAVLIAEIGERGMNIYSLLDRCWLVELQPGALRDRALLVALLERGLAYYAAQSRAECLLLLPEEAGTLDVESAGFHPAAPLLRWLASRDVLPAYLQYVEGLLGALRG
jgi:hypothetical protein